MSATFANGDLNDLSARLKQIANLRPELDVTQLQIINFDDVREAYGERWAEVRGRALRVAVDFLQKRITPEDLLIPCGNGFIVVFGSVEGASAEIAGLQLARSLSHFFMGTEGLEHFRFRCKHQTLEIAGIANLVRALSAVDPMEPIPGTLAHDDEAGQEVHFKFQPLWDVKHEAISTYLTTPFDSRGNSLQIDDVDSLGASLRRGYLARDMATIAATGAAMRKLLRRGDQVILAMTIHASTLADTAQRREVLEALSAIEPRLRRYLAIVLSDIVHGFPRYHLHEMLRLLGQKVERVCVDFTFDEPDPETIIASPAWAIGYRIPHMQNPLSAEVGESIQSRLQRDAKRARKHGKRMIVRVDDGIELVRMCRAAGVDFVGCEGIWPAVNAPRGIERWELPNPAAA